MIVTTLAQSGLARPLPRAIPLIVDTDVGSDDLLAIAFLLASPSARVEAITIANGLAHVDSGALNICRLLRLAGKADIPVYLGRTSPLQGSRSFPNAWRRVLDELPGVALPSPRRKPESQSAADFLARRWAEISRPVRVLALGPLTNIAEAFERKTAAAGLTQLAIMGGAVRVPGNLNDGGAFKTDNTTAEWNFFVDPWAASIVLGSGANMTLTPLDATSKVPIDPPFLKLFNQRARTPLGKFASQVLETDRPQIESGTFQAWDPLAAVALLHPGVVKTKPLAVEVLQAPPQDGRTVEAGDRRPGIAVALDADAAAFRRLFLSVF